jgi:hypothetical protein
MSHKHEDRVAERPSYLCAAYGCPLLGTRSTSTQGGDFMCHVHFGLVPGQLQPATVEIHRLEWLAHAIVGLRARRHNPEWRKTYQRIDHDLVLAQREDLRFKESETADAWMVRLETELAKLVKLSLEPQEQQELAA